MIQGDKTLCVNPLDRQGSIGAAEAETVGQNAIEACIVDALGNDISIAGFRVSPNNGHLSAIGQTPTEAVPRAFSIGLQGSFLYVAGLETGKLASYRIDPDPGKLDPGNVYDVGKGPMWVLITEF